MKGGGFHDSGFHRGFDQRFFDPRFRPPFIEPPLRGVLRASQPSNKPAKARAPVVILRRELGDPESPLGELSDVETILLLTEGRNHAFPEFSARRLLY
jgi:hypothetical protein